MLAEVVPGAAITPEGLYCDGNKYPAATLKGS
jgi:hypothetical protein